MQLYRVNPYNFGPACECETIVYGARAPESYRIMHWVSFMKDRDIQRVCCLLAGSEIDHVYTLQPIRETYNREFGTERICWAGIPNDCLSTKELLINTIIPFMRESVNKDEKVVVHCLAGMGRTSRILAAFLVQERKMEIEKALAAVKMVDGVLRNPLEGVGINFSKEELVSLLKPNKSNSGLQ